jgi:hypothetical protein
MIFNNIPTFKRDAQGRIVANPMRQFVKPFELTISAPNNTFTLPAGGRVGPLPMTARFDGPLELYYLKVTVGTPNIEDFVTDYAIRVLIESPGKRKTLMNRPIQLTSIAGTAGRVFVFPETIWLPSPQSLDFSFFSDAAVDLNVEMTIGAVKFYAPAAPSKLREELFGYASLRSRTYCYYMTTEADVTLTAGQTATNFANVPDDADLEIFKLTARDTNTTAGESFRTRIRDMSTDSAVTGDAIIAPNLWGGHDPTPIGGGIGGSGGIFPYRLPTSLLVRRSTQLEFTTTELGGGAHTIQYCLAGRKVENAS